MSATYTCPRCGRVSYNPHDLAQRYCGACHLFEDDLIRELIATEHLWRVSSPRFVAGVLVDAQGRIRTAAPILGSWRGHQLPTLQRFASEHGWQLEALS